MRALPDTEKSTRKWPVHHTRQLAREKYVGDPDEGSSYLVSVGGFIGFMVSRFRSRVGPRNDIFLTLLVLGRFLSLVYNVLRLPYIKRGTQGGFILFAFPLLWIISNTWWVARREATCYSITYYRSAMDRVSLPGLAHPMGFHKSHPTVFAARASSSLAFFLGFLRSSASSTEGTMAWGCAMIFITSLSRPTGSRPGGISWRTLLASAAGSSYGQIFNVLLAIEYALFGLFAPGWHAASVFLHGVTGFLFFSLAVRSRRAISSVSRLEFSFLFFPAAPKLWGGLPATASSRHTFYLVGIYWYLVFLHERKSLHYTLALLAALLSLFTKSGVTIFGAFSRRDLGSVAARRGFNHEFLIGRPPTPVCPACFFARISCFGGMPPDSSAAIMAGKLLPAISPL